MSDGAKGGRGAPAAGWAARLALLFVLGLGAAIFYPLNRLATEGGVPTLAYVFWQSLGAAILLGLVLAIRRERVPLSRAHLKFYLGSATLGIALPYLCLALAAPRVPVGVLALGLTLEPGFTYLLALVFALERFAAPRLGGLLIGIGGIMLIVLPQASLPAPGMAPWVLLGLVAPLSWAGWAVWIARAQPPAVSSLALTGAMTALAALLVLPAVLASGSWWWFAGEFATLGWIVVVLALVNAVFWLLAMETVRRLGAVFYSTWAFLATPLTVLAGIVFFGERHSLWIWSALVLLFASLALVNRTTPPARSAR